MSETKAMTTYSGVVQTAFGDRDAAKSDQTPQYKAQKGRCDRIAIVDPSLVQVGRAHGHFTDKNSATKGLGYVLCKSVFAREGDIEVIKTMAPCCQLLPDSRKRVATIIMQYAADPKTGRPTKPVEFKLLGWVFSADKFENLNTIHEEFGDKDADGNVTASGLGKVDLLITCEDDDFQKIKIVPTSPSSCVRNMPEFKTQFQDNINTVMAGLRTRLTRLIGRDVTDQELMAKAGDGAQAVPDAAPRVAQQAAPSDVNDLFS